MVSGSHRIVDLFRRRPSFPHLTVTDFGASPAADNQVAFTSALNAAKTQNLPLYVPPGTWRHSGRLTVDSVNLFGLAASSTTLLGTTTILHAIDLTGTNPGLHNLTIAGPGKSPRTSDRGGNGIYINAATGYVVRGCHVQDVSGAGMMTEDGHNGLIRGNLVERTGADGIYQTENTTNLVVAYNKTVATGDDAISFTSYAGGLGNTHDVEVHHNTCIGNFESRAITVNGGYNIYIHDNHIDGGTGGIGVTSVSEWFTVHSSAIGVAGNTIRNINQSRFSHGTIGGGAIHLWNDVGTGLDFDITFENNQIWNPGHYGLYVGGTAPITATVRSNVFWMDPTLTLVVNDNTGSGTTITQSPANTRNSLSGYVGDLVPATVGGLDTTYWYQP
jgi:hypothetical protein